MVLCMFTVQNWVYAALTPSDSRCHGNEAVAIVDLLASQ
jgi:hypothetical protein